MPNWCFTQYAICGERKEVRSLYAVMNRLQNREAPLLPNGFGKTWLGCLVKRLGKNPQSVYCRGEWRDLNLASDGTLTFSTEHAWSRPNEVEDLILEKYPSLSIYFLEEELGMDIFQTNDEYGQFFKETVILDDETDGMEYFTEEKAFERLSLLKGTPITDWEGARDFLDKYNAAQDAAGTERHLWLHKADIC